MILASTPLACDSVVNHHVPFDSLAYWLTYGVAFLGIVGSALRCYFGYVSVPKFKHPLCQILDDNFENGLDKTIWEQEVRMDGFG
jgi:hypothetical protein